MVGSYAGLLWFVTSHDLNRHRKPPQIDWDDGSASAKLLIIYIVLGFSTSVFQAYLPWLCSTFSNEPNILGRYSGYVEGMKGLGIITAFTIDSNQISFLREVAAYFSLTVAGIALCGLSTLVYTRDTRYGDERLVVVPKAFEEAPSLFAGGSLRQDSDSAEVEAGAVITEKS